MGEEKGQPEPRQACHGRQQVSRQHTALSMSEPIAQLRYHAYQMYPISTDHMEAPVKREENGLLLLFEGPNIDTDGEHTNIDKMIVQLNTFRERLQGQNAGDGLSEVAGVVGSLETDKVRREHSAKQRLANRQTAEDF
jgi:hypothetical protein